MERCVRGKGLGKPPNIEVTVPNTNVPKDLKQYINDKIKLLVREFFINLTTEEIAHFWELTTEKEVDRYAKRLLIKYL